MTTVTLTSLSPARKRLVRLMQQISFGRIEGLEIRDGEPVFEPKPRVIREVKFGHRDDPRRERDLDDFALKEQVLDMFKQIEAVGWGMIASLEVKAGLPFLMRVEDDAV